jgi:hypothetical protein
MSRCSEYEEKILAVEKEIRKLDGWPLVDREAELDRRQKLEQLERSRVRLKEQWERSMRRGGC